MATYTATLVYKLYKGATWTCTSTFSGSGKFKWVTTVQGVLQSVSSISISSTSNQYNTLSATATNKLPDFTSITSCKYTQSGSTPSNLKMYNAAGSSVGLNTSGGTMTASQLAVLTGIGATGKLKLYADYTGQISTPSKPSSSASGWSPSTWIDGNTHGTDYIAYKTVTQSASNTAYDYFSTQITLTITYEGEEPIPPFEADYPNHCLQIEKKGVAIGCAPQAESISAPQTDIAINAAHLKTADLKKGNYDQGWMEIDLENVAKSTTAISWGRAKPGAFYKKEFGHRVCLSLNISFTGSSSSVLVGYLPNDVKPAENINFFGVCDIYKTPMVYCQINGGSSGDGGIYISKLRNSSSIADQTATKNYCDAYTEWWVD